MAARELMTRVAIAVATVAIATGSSMILRLVIWPGLAWSEGRITIALILWVAVGVGVWCAGVMLSIQEMAKLMKHRSRRHLPTVVAGCTVVGLVIGGVLRRLLFEEPWDSDYPLIAYVLLYAVGLLGAITGVWLTSETSAESGTSRP